MGPPYLLISTSRLPERGVDKNQTIALVCFYVTNVTKDTENTNHLIIGKYYAPTIEQSAGSLIKG